jgi:predicted GIY-YIG superfamily endonuclease
MSDASAARREEARIKRLTREQKLTLIAGSSSSTLR